MAALLWRVVLLCELLGSGAVAVGLSRTWAVPAALHTVGAIAAALCVFVLLQGLPVVMSYGRARWVSRAGAVWPGALAIVRESVAWLRAMLAMSALAPRRNGIARVPDAAVRPVILVHGLLCNGRIWGALERKLAAAGIAPVLAVSLEPLLSDLDVHAGTLARAIETLYAQTGERVTLVAHSMGGLIARAALRTVRPGLLHQIVTLGTPHCGTRLARALPLPPVRQMRPDSAWLETLNFAQADGLGVPLSCLYSTDDNLIVPAVSGTFPHATTIRLDGLGHLSLLFCDRALDAVITQLRRTD
ncbi:MAG: alpha/beta fold hydrolase [Pseudomonadota bacterium]|jgi:pimeloyl-ACP methyl ester carboxylesterase|nr:alpha/beta fold hydrolase [Pseudomonadota bacterium]